MRSVTHRAGWVMSDPWTLIPNGYVTTAADRIREVGPCRGQGRAAGADSGTIIDHGPGLLMPCLVNAHGHMELCALGGKTVSNRGFIAWVESVIALKADIADAELISAARDGYGRSLAQGVRVLGDISTSGITESVFHELPVLGVLFREYLGSAWEDPLCQRIEPAKTISLAGHAPHTTAPDLLIRLKNITRQQGLPFAIHLAESAAEKEFIATGAGPWADLLRARTIDFSAWRFFQQSPVAYADTLGLLDDATLAVHLVYADKTDIRLLAARKVKVCLCPQSNMFLHGRLPDLPAILDAGIKPCLGTDSPASNPDASIWAEMAFLAKSFPGITPSEVLAMATCNGAAALGFGDLLGRVEPGFMADLIYVPIHATTPQTVMESLVHDRPYPDLISNI
jgi:aminodeoxyfutalosine deaminase